MKIDKAKLKNIPIIGLYAIGLLLVAIVELLSIEQNTTSGEVKLHLSTENIANSLPSTVVSYVAIALYTTATMLSAIAKFRSTNKDFIDLETKIADFSRNNYIPITFNKYCQFVNRKRKINAWKKKMNSKWRKLEKKQTEKDYTEWVRFQAEKEENENATTTNKYCLTRVRLEEMMSDEYIEAHIHSLDVKYDKINAGVVLGGVKADGQDLDEDEYITKNKALIVVLDRAPSYIMTMAAITLVTSIVVDSFDLRMHWTAVLLFVFKILVKVYSMANAIISTNKYASAYNERVTMKDMRFRWGVCSEYLIWHNQQLTIQKEKDNVRKNRTNENQES